VLRAHLKKWRTKLVMTAHGSGARILSAPPGPLEEHPLDVTAGAPRARTCCALQTPDGKVFTGEWDCSAGSFTWRYNEDELIRILEGEAFIEIDGEFRRFGPGDTIFFPLGQSARWRVPKYVRKVFFIRHPGRAVQLLRTLKMPGRSVS